MDNNYLQGAIDDEPPAPGGTAEPTGRRLRFANEVGLPLVSTSVIANNESIDSLNTAARAEGENKEEEVEEEEVEAAEPVKANTSLPTILRIGNGGKFDEFINLTEQKFKSTGGFSILHKGGQKELQTLYSVLDADRLVVLQKAFGVRRLSDKPPLMAVLEQGCTPDYNTDAIDQALESRISTLEAELASMKQTIQKGMKQAFLKVLQDVLDGVRGLPDNAPCPPSTHSGGPGAGSRTGSSAGASSSAGSGPVAEPNPTGCPCLDDLDLLRDLVMLVVTLMGIASPQVKAQLDEVRLDDILGLLNSENSATATVRLREVLKTLGDLEVATNGEAGGDGNLQEILSPIWQVLTTDDIPETLTVDAILAKIREVISSSTDNLAASQEELARLQREIAGKEREVVEIQRQLSTAGAGTATAAELATAKTTLAEKESKIAALTARAEAAEGKVAESKVADEAKAAQLAELQAQLAAVTAKLEALRSSQAAAEAAISSKKEELDRKAAELAGIVPALEAETAALKESNKAAQQTAAEKTADVARLTAELRTAKEGLAKAKADHEAEKAAAETRKQELSTQLGALEGRIRATEGAADAISSQSSAKDAELAQLRADKGVLQAELNALKAKGPEQAAALAVAEAEFKRQIKECQEALEKLRTEKNAQITAKNAELAAQKLAHETTIAGLKTQIADAEAKAINAGDNATGQIAAAQTNRNTKVAEAKAEAEAAKTKAKEELNAVVAGAAAKNAEIANLKEQLAAAQKAKEDCDKELAEKKAEFAEISASLPKPGEIEEQAALKAAEMQKHTGEEAAKNAAHVAQIRELEAKIGELNDLIASLQLPSEETQTKLNDLLSVILVDTNLQNAAQKFMTKEGKLENLDPIKAKMSDIGILSPELCDFYTYLYGLISLQSKKLPPRLQPDILQKFKTPPTADKNKELLKEIALIFQAFFIMGETRTIHEDLTLSADVPQISKFINSLDTKPLNLKEGVESDGFGRELWGTGLLGELALMPKEGTTKLTLTKLEFKSYLADFVQNNTRKVLPFAVLAIKLIQLLHNDLNEKYFDIRTKCGMTATFKGKVATPAAEVELKGGGNYSDEIEFEEFTL